MGPFFSLRDLLRLRIYGSIQPIRIRPSVTIIDGNLHEAAVSMEVLSSDRSLMRPCEDSSYDNGNHTEELRATLSIKCSANRRPECRDDCIEQADRSDLWIYMGVRGKVVRSIELGYIHSFTVISRTKLSRIRPMLWQ